MHESSEHLRSLRQRVTSLEGRRGDKASSRFASGHDLLDSALGGGIVRGRLHEVCAVEIGDASSATAFAALLAWRARGLRQPILWLRTHCAEQRSRLYAPGIAVLGIDPGALVLGIAPDNTGLLRSAADAARCVGFGAVVIECWHDPRALDLTASRRLVLAAEASGVTVILLRIDAMPSANAADTRFGIRAAPSAARDGDPPSDPVFDVEVLRSRTGQVGRVWRMEWNRDRQSFGEPALSGAVVRPPAGGSLADQWILRRRTG